MVEIIEQLQSIDYGTLLGSLAILIVAVPKIKTYLDDFEIKSGFQFPWTTRKKELQKKLTELDNKINATRKELDERIDSIHAADHTEHETWHQQSITIRDNLANDQQNLANNQQRLEENQKAFMETLANISSSLAELKADFLDERLERKRWNIINCASKLRNGEFVDWEEFNNVFDDYDSYEAIIDKHGFKNGKVEESIKFIREKYQELLCHENK